MSTEIRYSIHQSAAETVVQFGCGHEWIYPGVLTDTRFGNLCPSCLRTPPSIGMRKLIDKPLGRLNAVLRCD